MAEALAQTVLQMGMTNYHHYAVTQYALFRYALYTVVTHVSYANSVTRFIRRQYTYDVAPFYADVVISRTILRHNAFSTEILVKNFNIVHNKLSYNKYVTWLRSIEKKK